MLDMKDTCEKCGADLPNDAANAMICSFECTFCASCVQELDGRCPNCGGNLVERPRRAS